MHPYIICFQECWHGSLSLSDYHPIIKKDRQITEGGGVAMLIHKSCKVKILPSPFIEGLFETQCCEIALGNETFRIYNIYWGGTRAVSEDNWILKKCQFFSKITSFSNRVRHFHNEFLLDDEHHLLKVDIKFIIIF